MFTKANYHFDYLKKTSPEELKQYSNFLDTAKGVVFDKYITLLFPWFTKSFSSEKTKELIKLEKRIRLLCNLLYFDLVFIVIVVITVIVVFGEH